ncbi:archaeal heat shock regulator, ArsR family [Thermococcus kodakarensis KOD1]|uniref:Archaeal heat shock regulator, ArsR family n=1 Tax=Thermococcus kodakarensis (strain ATCC BAA-918 / JCM 12380 / KOD1) TaxID=69014 RepID=Q5JDC8_THEKO|nr:ArsR family transcriptional regulator [Thermococcus kodakarensis]WCN29481.1 ArsR family transcriptional regulator [Thermococcus kodakarensis]WCN31764.1 ArsR family transcriptional regulator [Thermococcus kodakarensis]BAD86480.1 archaeal heat shock regulator, ArsR family [Thermococcus kodakarensis KOD1]
MESNRDLGRLLDILGNETRRRILLLLTKRPYFVSELSQELGVGQKAVLEHLRILESAGLIEGRTEKIPRGRPRKYYTIKRGFRLEVLLTPYTFGTDIYEPKKPRATAEYQQARELIKSTEPIETKVDELVQFLDEVQRRIDEAMRMKQELEEVRLLVETYIENLMRRIAQENEAEFERLLKELRPKLPKKILEDLESF